nr:glycosyltransferase family 39 protein [uncultured Cohaesibacter sp.]
MPHFPLREFLTLMRFGIVGVGATLVHMSVAAGLVHFALANVFIANLAAYMTAFLVAFTGHFLWTFQKGAPLKQAIWRYFVISLSAFGANNLVLLGLVESGLVSKVTSVIIAAAIVPAISYVASRLWGFKEAPVPLGPETAAPSAEAFQAIALDSETDEVDEATDVPSVSSRLHDRVMKHPAFWFWALVMIHLVLWTLVPTLVYRNLPLDVIELVTWGHEWQLGYFKHPPLPSWLLEGATILFGKAEWPAYMLSQLSIVIAFWAIWRLGRAVIGAKAALLSVFLTSLIYFYNFPTPEFNHNVLQVPVWALMALVGWYALKQDKLWQWLALGLLTGTAVYIKYSMAILVVALLLFLLIEPQARQRLRSKGLWLASLLALLISAPHLYWLIDSNFQSLAYASTRSAPLEGITARILGPLGFVGAQIGHHGALLLVLVLGGGLLPFWRKGLTGRVSFAFAGTLEQRYILWIALVPILLTILLSVISGSEMRPMWPAPMFSFSALALLGSLKTAYYKDRFRAMVIGWAALYFGILVVIASMGLFGSHFIKKPLRVDWPGSTIASHFSKAWQSQFGQPLAFVGGNAWIGGNVSFYAPERPSLVYLEDWGRSPWADPAQVRCQGLLILWQQKDGSEPRLPDYEGIDLKKISASGLEAFPWKVTDKPFRIGWAMMPPEPDACQ